MKEENKLNLNTYRGEGGQRTNQISSLPRGPRSQQENRLRRDVLREIERNLDSEGEFKILKQIYDETDINVQKLEKDLKSPKGNDKFPELMLSLAILKDVGDIITGTVASWALSIVFLVCYFFYIRRRLGFGARFLFGQLAKGIAWLLAGSIPVIGAIPESVVMILLTHWRHKKIVKVMVVTYGALTRHKLNMGKIASQLR